MIDLDGEVAATSDKERVLLNADLILRSSA
jgi:hypothetical protein